MSKPRVIPTEEQLAFELGYRQAIRDIIENHAAECDELNKSLLFELIFQESGYNVRTYLLWHRHLPSGLPKILT